MASRLAFPEILNQDETLTKRKLVRLRRVTAKAKIRLQNKRAYTYR